MPLTKEQLHSILVESGGVTEEQFKKAAESKEAQEVGIGGTLVARGTLTDEQLGQLMSFYFEVPFAALKSKHIEQAVLGLLPESFARAHDILPMTSSENVVEIATKDPENLVMKSLLEKYLRKEVKFVYATPTDLGAHMYLFQANPKEVFKQILEQVSGAKETDTKIIDLVDAILNYAYQGGASDIHIEPEDDYTMIRFRTDGILHDIAELPVAVHEPIMTRLKVLSRLATDEHRAAQDGKITHKSQWGDEVEIRLSIVPTTHAEKAVMRLLSDKSRRFSLTDLGFHTSDYQKVSDVIHKPWGAILVTGPTGSGKTTSLYAVLKILNQREVNITTIEDPVEYDIEGVNQIQVNEKTDLTFAKGLRSVVRQDPDIIMVGEIRDSETAGIAVNAAMTGHLVLSTLHTNDSATAFPRLQDMEVEDFLIASTVNVVIAQRLVRKICASCRQSAMLTKIEKELTERIPIVQKYLQEISSKETVDQVRTFKGKGCNVCHQTGFAGRVGVFEVLVVSDAIREAVMDRKNADEIRKIAMGEGMSSMLYDGLRKVVSGVTTLEEVLRVTRE
jgi:type IV pilus assembly protein PilB